MSEVSGMKRIYLADIQAEVASGFGIRLRDMSSRRRWSEYIVARHVAMFLARRHTSLSFPQIGARFNRDHSTVFDAVKNMEARLEADQELADRVSQIEARILA